MSGLPTDHTPSPLSRVLQFDFIASIRRKPCSPIHAKHFQIELSSVHVDDHVMVWVQPTFRTRLHQMIERYLLSFIGFQIVTKIGLPRIGVYGRSSAA